MSAAASLMRFAFGAKVSVKVPCAAAGDWPDGWYDAVFLKDLSRNEVDMFSVELLRDGSRYMAIGLDEIRRGSRR